MPDEREYQNALNIALNFFMGESGPASEETVERILDSVLAFPTYRSLDRQRLRDLLEGKINVIVAAPQVLEDGEGHVPWLPEKRANIDWDFWHRYRRFLLERKQWAPATIQGIDDATDQVLERLEDPEDFERAWERRGMVVGHVQSGKTANFTGLICKAVDAGYKVIIVLAGQHNNLRAQTQMRIDREFLGVDTAQVQRADNPTGQIGVRELPGVEHPPVISLTTRLEDGDFKANRLSTNLPLGPLPIILVVKKRGNILTNLYRWLAHGQSARLDQTVDVTMPTCGCHGRHIIDRAPLLVIDDEADHSSVNTEELPLDENGRPVDDADPTAINRLIRQILMLFPQRAYVGYTATPFANIFIHSEATHRVLGPDLFPKSFIISLPTPSNYSGPVEVFGLGDGTRPPQPVIRPVTDHSDFVPDRHKAPHVPGRLPASLKQAIRAFILSCAIRRVRGQEKEHCSMLVHVTRFNAVQEHVKERVKEEFDDLRNQIRYGSGARSPSVREELRQLWEEDFAPTTRLMGREPEVWEAIEAQLLPAVEKVAIRKINGTSADILDYQDHEQSGISVIAIGGDKLSRGLTLEGLSVSYYLRASRMYDTLMQMGRWFGYRPGYEDVCRIYTTTELAGWYQHIAAASEELRQEFDYMVTRGETPETYGLRVRSHKTLMVTSAVKMRSGETLDLSYDGNVSEITVYDPRADILQRNFDRTDGFLRRIGRPSKQSNHFVWKDVRAAEVLEFLRGFSTHTTAPDVNSGRLADFIEAQNHIGELTAWTVVLVNRNSNDAEEADALPTPEVTLGGLKVSCTKRRPAANKPGASFSIKRLLSPTHEALDLAPDEVEAAWEITRAMRSNGEPSRLNGKAIRVVRPEQRGLLLIYPLDKEYLASKVRVPGEYRLVAQQADFALAQAPIGLGLSFPSSDNAVRIKYRVNNVWQQQEEEDLQ